MASATPTSKTKLNKPAMPSPAPHMKKLPSTCHKVDEGGLGDSAGVLSEGLEGGGMGMVCRCWAFKRVSAL